MYIIVVYDVGEKRVGKILKLCRQYLCWIQNSVFEGELSEAKLRELKQALWNSTMFLSPIPAPLKSNFPISASR